MLRSLSLTNLLSFGPEPTTLELGPMNLLIGPNASGKSNLLEAIALLRSAPKELVVPIREGGGVLDWLYKDGSKKIPTAQLEALVERPQAGLLRYRLAFTGVSQRLEVIDERIEDQHPWPGHPQPYFYFGYANGRPMLNRKDGDERALRREDINFQSSILSQRSDPESYPEIAFLARSLGAIKLYRDWEFGRYAPPRRPQGADLPNDFLQEDCANLGVVLNSFSRHPESKKLLLSQLQLLYEGIESVDVILEGGTAQIFLTERGRVFPATRLSDGTLRYLSLLAVLCHPNPPPLLCIEEPELGIHPDLIPSLADLMLQASQSTQLIVTTHSASLVDAFHQRPECLVITERERGTTSLRRLQPEALQVWLEQYRLGQLWTRGDLGGTRW